MHSSVPLLTSVFLSRLRTTLGPGMLASTD